MKKNTPRRILLVEDNRDALGAMELLLGLDGYEVRTAIDGRQGYRAFLESSPDIIVTDLNMPSMDGLELIRTIRADQRFPNTPVIVISAHGNQSEEVKNAGADFYLPKPYDYEDLKKVIDTILSRQSNGLAA